MRGGKRRFEIIIMNGSKEVEPASSSLIDHVQAERCSNVVIFHPGSKNLRFGKMLDVSPITVLHAIGRRRKSGGGVHKDGILPTQCQVTTPPEVESARLQLCHTLQTALKSDGSSRFVTPTQTISGLNNCSRGESLDSCKKTEWEEFNGQNLVVGDDILRLDPYGEFNIHFPWRRGEPNVLGLGGPLSSVINDLCDIWTWCLEEKLKISSINFKNYKAIVIVPSMLSKSHTKEIMSMLLNMMGFSCVFLIQDHVMASFGCATPIATIIDVGDQKISVSCVEDGISYPQSRITLRYGGVDLTYALLHLMNGSSVPFQANRTEIWDMQLVNSIKERYCHLDLDRCGPEEHSILWDKPGTPSFLHKTHFGDELLVVPLSYFNPDLLRGSIGPKPMVVFYNSSQPYLSDDPFDEGYITETSRKGKDTDEGEEDGDYDKQDDCCPQTSKLDSDTLLGIDQAILQSIESSEASDESKRRLYSCIVVVGGGFKFKGLGKWLQNRLNTTIPRSFKTDVEVITQPKDTDPAIVTWKGASILAQLETCSELWVTKEEWNKFGFRILRERSLYNF